MTTAQVVGGVAVLAIGGFVAYQAMKPSAPGPAPSTPPAKAPPPPAAPSTAGVVGTIGNVIQQNAGSIGNVIDQGIHQIQNVLSGLFR